MIAAFAQVNGVDLRQENHGALQRLAERVMKESTTRKPSRRRPARTRT